METLPTQTQPAPAQPATGQPASAQPVPAQAVPAQAVPAQAKPAQAKPDVPTENLSPQYSSLCGILAGFAFVGFSIYLAQDELLQQAANIAASLFAAFVTLILLAVLYALMSADGSVNRVTIGLFVYGLPFGLSSVTLFYTLTLMATEKPRCTRPSRSGASSCC